MTKAARRKIDAVRKAKIALDAVRGQATAVELVQRYEVHPNQIYALKKQLVEQGSRAFDPNVGVDAEKMALRQVDDRDAQPPPRPVPKLRRAGPSAHRQRPEQAFGAPRYRERRATGRKSASPAAVLRGGVRLIAATTTRLQEQNAADLARTDWTAWRTLRARLDQRRQACTLRTRFRRDPHAYLKALKQNAVQPTLPA